MVGQLYFPQETNKQANKLMGRDLDLWIPVVGIEGREMEGKQSKGRNFQL